MHLLEWKMIHPQCKLVHLGAIPYWFVKGDRRTAKEIINASYPFGGFQPFNGFALLNDNSIKYPGDPVHKPLAIAQHGDETIVFYQSAWVAIIQKDRTFEIARID